MRRLEAISGKGTRGGIAASIRLGRLRTGAKLAELKTLLESRGATVVGLAVIIYQPTPQTLSFGSLPLYYLAKLEARYYAAGAECALCKRGLPLEKVWI